MKRLFVIWLSFCFISFVGNTQKCEKVMFTGKVRLSWFKEERPVEYARAVEEGTLESIIVPPPSKSFRAVARTFGFAAYFIGLFLVIAIFVTLLTVRH